MRATQEAISGNAPEWWSPLRDLFRSWAQLSAALTNLAAGLYANALAKVGLLGKFGRTLFVVLGTIAAFLAPIAATALNQSASLGQRLFVFIVPAVPFILPYLIGVNLVRRAGDPAS